MNPRRVALTGAQGFIGQVLTQNWSEEDGVLEAWPGNLLDDATSQAFLQKYRPQVVIHLAGDAAGSLSQIFDNNVFAVQKLADNFIKYGGEHIVFASTGAVYGNTGRSPVAEDFPRQPNTEYGLSKLLAEETLNFHARQKNVTAVILRFPSVFGPNNSKGMLFQMLQRIEQGQPVIIEGDGQQIRSFLGVEDAARALLLASKHLENEILNIAGPVATVQEVVGKLHERYTFSVKHGPAENDLQEMVLDASRAQKILGWQPQTLELIL